MRVISGTARGQILFNTKNVRNRSTTDRVKESMFNVLYNIHVPHNVLDLFAGSGALGIETLSRGSDNVTFVDKDLTAILTIRKNLKKTNFLDKSKIIKLDWKQFLNKSNEKFDTIFLDPPYNLNILDDVFSAIIECKILEHDGYLIVEHENDIKYDKVSCIRYKKYGRVKLSVCGLL